MRIGFALHTHECAGVLNVRFCSGIECAGAARPARGGGSGRSPKAEGDPMASKKARRSPTAGPDTGGVLPAGTRAPDFELRTTPDQKVSLRDFRGRPVILAFYPADWSPVCGDQMALYNEILPEFQ